ncbi:MAG: NAD(P)-dependent oxidoreductase, partial [Xanthomonadales bacterium]|nr:NAD(P)-dependent oxidoreductase [Xanthomonadales bacterium]
MDPEIGMPYFPIFMDIEARPVLVVGGGAVAARKVRALLKAGAAVSVIARALGDELSARAEDGEIDWAGTSFSHRSVEGFWLVFAATDDPAVNQAVFDAGEASGVPVNTVDNAALCRFISPAVVDRDPVQVAISTGGESPVLARAIRRWIEDLLPRGLGKIAHVAGRLRRSLGPKVPIEERRRRFGFLFDRAQIVRWSSEPAGTIARHMRRLFAGPENPGDRGTRHVGKVVLVGAGPGRAELLTLRAFEVLQQADVILHDRLVPEEVLNSHAGQYFGMGLSVNIFKVGDHLVYEIVGQEVSTLK